MGLKLEQQSGVLPALKRSQAKVQANIWSLHFNQLAIHKRLRWGSASAVSKKKIKKAWAGRKEGGV